MTAGLLLLGGLPASGKSTVATWLLHSLGGPTYDMTVIEGDDCLKQAACEEEDKEEQREHVVFGNTTMTTTMNSPSAAMPDTSGKSQIFARSREILRERVKGALLKEVSPTTNPRLVVVVDNFQLRGMRMEMWRLCRDANCTAADIPPPPHHQPSEGTVSVEGTFPIATPTVETSSPPLSEPSIPSSPPTTTKSTIWCFSEAFLDVPLSDLIHRNHHRGTPTLEGSSTSSPILTVTVDTIHRMHATFDWGLLPLRHSVPRMIFRTEKDSREMDHTATSATLYNTICTWIDSSCFTYAPKCHCERCCGVVEGDRDDNKMLATPPESILHQVDTALRGVVAEVMKRLSEQNATHRTLSGKEVSTIKMAVLKEAQSELGGGSHPPLGDSIVVCEEYTSRLRRLLQKDPELPKVAAK